MATAVAVDLLELYGRMCLVRAFEERVGRLYRDGAIPGFIHTSLGQEAVAVGVCAALQPDDYLVTTHRGHGHVLAKGADVDGAMAELFGKATGLCNGKGGSVRKSGRAVVAHEAVVDFGAGAEVAQRVTESCWGDLRAPVARVGSPPVPMPFSPPLEDACIPSAETVAAAVRRVLA
jgi:TPP-dependent pyruvate/acetoin dehydrogenase alpha subunit